MYNYFLMLSLILRLTNGNTDYKENFNPPTKTTSFTVKDASILNKSGTCILTDDFLGIFDIPKLKLKQVYVYNEHTDDKYKGFNHWMDDPLIIVSKKDYWYRLFSTQWTKKTNVTFLPDLEAVDDNIEFNWMPKVLWVGEQWHGEYDVGGRPWTYEFHKIMKHEKGIWYIHSISVYKEAPKNMASCYDEQYQDDILLHSLMTNCDHKIVGEITFKR